MLTKKIQRQSVTVTMKPPSGGPNSGPMREGMVREASAATSSAFGTERRMMSRPTGTIIAPPTPWTSRQAANDFSERENAQPMEAAMNTASAVRKVVRAPSRSATQPLIGTNTASLEQIGRHRELQSDRIDAEVARDGRQRDRQDRRIHVLHEQGGRDDQGDDAELHAGFAEPDSAKERASHRLAGTGTSPHGWFDTGVVIAAGRRPSQRPRCAIRSRLRARLIEP